MKYLLQILAVTALLLTNYTAKAQMDYDGEPYSFNHTLSLAVHTIEFDALDEEALLAEDETAGKNQALRIGVKKEVNYTILNAGRIDILSNGGRLWRLALHFEDATFSFLHFSTFHIPDGAEIFFYTPDREFVIGKFTNKDQMEDGTFYPQEIPGEDVIIEYYEPAGCAFRGNLAIDFISQGYRDLFNIRAEKDGAQTCHPNAICKDATTHMQSQDGTWHQQIQAVALLVINGSGACTGTMINNTANDNKKYFLTANHCYENGASCEFYFKYQSPQCSPTTEPNLTYSNRVTGANLRARSYTGGDNEPSVTTSSDFMLLEISGNIKASNDVYLAGWDRSTSTPSNPTYCGCIHHPAADVKKFSTPRQISTGGSPWNKYWETTWNKSTGTTEGGSSGSALFNARGLIVGQLYGGTSSCTEYGNNYPDYFGKFSNSWTNSNNSNSAKKLQPWLDPKNTGTTALQGRWMNGAPSSIKSNEAANLNVLPNPSNGIVTVSGSYNEGEGICNIYNMMGTLVFSKSINLNDETTLNLTKLTPGMYMLEIYDNNDIYRTKILISK